MNRFHDAESLIARSVLWTFVRRLVTAGEAAARTSRAAAAIRQKRNDFLRLDPGLRLRIAAVLAVTFGVVQLLLLAAMPAWSAPSLAGAAWWLLLQLAVLAWIARQWWKRVHANAP